MSALSLSFSFRFTPFRSSQNLLSLSLSLPTILPPIIFSPVSVSSIFWRVAVRAWQRRGIWHWPWRGAHAQAPWHRLLAFFLIFFVCGFYFVRMGRWASEPLGSETPSVSLRTYLRFKIRKWKPVSNRQQVSLWLSRPAG